MSPIWGKRESASLALPLVGVKRSDAKARSSRPDGRLGGRPPRNATTPTTRTNSRGRVAKAVFAPTITLLSTTGIVSIGEWTDHACATHCLIRCDSIAAAGSIA